LVKNLKLLIDEVRHNERIKSIHVP
jgi:hypothetical protein